MQAAPDNLQEFMKTEADPELLRDMLIAERSNNMKEYRRLRSKLLKDYTDYCRYGSNE